MTILKEIIKVKDGVLQMKLPDEFRDKTVEIVITVSDDIEKKLLIDNVKIDTKKWKFNREEIYGQ